MYLEGTFLSIINFQCYVPVYTCVKRHSFIPSPFPPPSVCRWLSCVVRQGESGGGTWYKECTETSVELIQVKVALSLMTCHCLSLVHARGRSDPIWNTISISKLSPGWTLDLMRLWKKTKWSIVLCNGPSWYIRYEMCYGAIGCHPSQTQKCMAYYPLSRATGCSRCTCSFGDLYRSKAVQHWGRPSHVWEDYATATVSEYIAEWNGKSG